MKSCWLRPLLPPRHPVLRKPLRLGRLFGVPPRFLLWLPPFLLALVPSFAGFACYSFYVINQSLNFSSTSRYVYSAQVVGIGGMAKVVDAYLGSNRMLVTLPMSCTVRGYLRCLAQNSVRGASTRTRRSPRDRHGQWHQSRHRPWSALQVVRMAMTLLRCRVSCTRQFMLTMKTQMGMSTPLAEVRCRH